MCINIFCTIVEDVICGPLIYAHTHTTMALPGYATYAPVRGDTGYMGGLIPEDIYLRKIEVTGPAERDPYLVEQFMRSNLMDTRPDPPAWASDEIRSSNDEGSLGFFSKQRLELRHNGYFTPDMPYLPDGTFLDYIGGLTDRDPRPANAGPDFRRYDEQRFARASMLKMYDDSDWSVPSEGINPQQMVANIKSGMYMFKDRYQNFEESMDGWTQASAGVQERKNYGPQLFRQDGVILDIANSEVKNRVDAVSKLSADPTVAFRHSTPDHRFKIARYGQTRANQYLGVTDYWNNRTSSYVDHRLPRDLNGQLVNKMLANLIVDLQGQRDTKEMVAQGATYGDSYVRQMQQRKLMADDVYKILQVVGSAPASANEQNYDGRMLPGAALLPPGTYRESMDNTRATHSIVESMQQATRTALEKGSSHDDLRENIARSAADLSHAVEQSAGHGLAPMSRGSESGSRESRATHATLDEHREMANYAQAVPVAEKPANQNASFEEFRAESRAGFKSVRPTRPGDRHVAARHSGVDQDQGLAEFGTYDGAPHARGDHRPEERGQDAQTHDTQYGKSTGKVESDNMLGLPAWLSTAFSSIMTKNTGH